jgi:hypothetical protein
MPIIRANIDRNHEQGRVTVFNRRIGDGTDGSLTLDQLATETFSPDFVKLDIEGSETEAILGGGQILDEAHAWLIEVHSRDAERACIIALARHHYDLELVNPRWWLPDRRPDPHNRWLIASR